MKKFKGTLLTNFITEEMHAYIEPPRKSGFPATKNASCLYMLTNWLQKDISVGVGVSHGMLRKWLTEPKFRDTIKKYEEKFAKIFTEYWILQSEKTEISFDALVDRDTYSISLAREIFENYKIKIPQLILQKNWKAAFILWQAVKMMCALHIPVYEMVPFNLNVKELVSAEMEKAKKKRDLFAKI